MPVDSRRNRIVVAVAMVCISILLMGCDLYKRFISFANDGDVPTSNAKSVEQSDDPIVDWKIEEGFTLAEGQVLGVRLHYGDALSGDSSPWYQVRIDNKRNGWYDLHEWTASYGFGSGEDNTKSDDYIFNAENFNKQITQTEYYDPKDVDGDYTLTITNSQGYSSTREIQWRDGRFRPSQTLAFSVP